MAELNFSLLKWQRTVFNDKTRFKVVMAGRRCGKTRIAACMLIIKTLQCPDPLARVMYVAPTQAMAIDLMWDLVVTLGESVIRRQYIADNNIEFINGVTLQIRGADKPDRLRGKKIFYAVLDEMKDMKDDVWELNVRPSLADMEGEALIIGTPEPGENKFNELFDYGESGTDPEWKSWLFTTLDNETINPKEIEAARKSMSTAAFEQEFMANRNTAGQNVLRLEWLKYGTAPKVGDTYIAVDLAGFSEVTGTKKNRLDFTAIAVVKVGDDGHWFVQKIEHGRWDVRETAVRILMAIRTFQPICMGIEKGSLMRAVLPYLSDLMRKNNVFAHIEAIPTSGSSKVNRITYGIQGLLEHGRITLNERENWDELKREMLAFPLPKAHDDLIDALSMVAHLVTVIYSKPDDSDDYEVMDDICGF